MEKDLREIGERVKQARLARGLSQADLAEKLNMSVTYLSKIENGRNVMSITVLVKISDALNVSTDWLLRNETHRSQECTMAELEELCKDCNSTELNALLKLLQQMKETLRNVKKEDRK